MDLEEARLQAEKTERGVRREVRERRLALRESAERAGVQREAADHARLALKSVEARYAAGESGQLELNDSTLALNRARLAEAQALEEYWTGRAAVERAVGIPLEEVQP
jgi:outer membrane protein TolC